jgi:hypothetical protein
LRSTKRKDDCSTDEQEEGAKTKSGKVFGDILGPLLSLHKNLLVPFFGASPYKGDKWVSFSPLF